MFDRDLLLEMASDEIRHIKEFDNGVVRLTLENREKAMWIKRVMWDEFEMEVATNGIKHYYFE